MSPKQTRRKKVSFQATVRVPRKVDVYFRTAKGQRVSFKATKRVPKKVNVKFYAKRKKRR